MNFIQILSALKSIGVEPHKKGNTYSFYLDGCEMRITGNEYSCLYPDDYDRLTKTIIDNIPSEKEFIQTLLGKIKNENFKNHDKFNQVLILSEIYRFPDNNLKYTHTCLFHQYSPLWTTLNERIAYNNQFKMNILTSKNQLFNKPYCYGIGLVDGKYIVAYQDPYPSGDRPHSYYTEQEYETFYDAYIKLEEYAKHEIDNRQKQINSYIYNYNMDKEEADIAQKMCDLLNDKFMDTRFRFSVDSEDFCKIVFIKDLGYYSLVTANQKIVQPAQFHCNGKNMKSVVNSYENLYIDWLREYTRRQLINAGVAGKTVVDSDYYTGAPYMVGIFRRFNINNGKWTVYENDEHGKHEDIFVTDSAKDAFDTIYAYTVGQYGKETK